MFKKLLFLFTILFSVGMIHFRIKPEIFSKVYYEFGGTFYSILAALAVGITFAQVPSGRRVPGHYIEFNNQKAIQAAQLQPYKIAVIGQLLSTGTATAGTPVQVTSYDQAKVLFGAGSLLASMAKALFDNTTKIETWFFPLAEIAGGTQATGKISIVASSVESGTLYLYIEGQRLQVPITSGMTAAQIASAIVDKITDNAGDLPVTAAINGTNNYEVDLTCNWKGTTGNEIDVRINYYSDESLPIGVTPTITPMSGGATDPDVQDALDLFLETHYNVVINPYTDSGSLTAIETALSARDDATIQKDGYSFQCVNDTFANLATKGNSKNSQFLIIIGNKNSPSPSYRWAAALGANCAFEGQNDPAKPVQTVELVGILPPVESDRFESDERDLLLYDGISTFYVDANGKTRIERIITTYKTNPSGGADASYLNWETMSTLSYLRYDFRNTFLRKFPRFKLADDGNRYPPGVDVLTPKAAKAEAIAIFLNWLELALVENLEGFKESLIVERNAIDRDRLDFEISPDLINQFRVSGVKISFIL